MKGRQYINREFHSSNVSRLTTFYVLALVYRIGGSGPSTVYKSYLIHKMDERICRNTKFMEFIGPLVCYCTKINQIVPEFNQMINFSWKCY